MSAKIKCEQCSVRPGVRIQRGRSLCLACAETGDTFTSAGNLPCPRCKNPSCQDETHLIRGARTIGRLQSNSAVGVRRSARAAC